MPLPHAPFPLSGEQKEHQIQAMPFSNAIFSGYLPIRGCIVYTFLSEQGQIEKTYIGGSCFGTCSATYIFSVAHCR